MPALGTRRDPKTGLTTPADNLVSTGQTITSSQYGSAGYNVYLLATATCGPVTRSSARALTIQYQTSNGPDISTPELMAVPDWLSNAPTDPANGLSGKVPLSTHLNGTATVNEENSLYVLRFPVSEDFQGDPILNVTLPRVGTTFNNAPCGQPGSQALHIFAMAIK